MHPLLRAHAILSATFAFQQSVALLTIGMLTGKVAYSEDRPKRKTDGVDFNRVSAGPASEAQRLGFPISVVDGVAIIRLEGPMDRYGDWYGGCSTAEVTVAVLSAAADPAIAATVIMVNSPGGSVDGLAELGDAVKLHADTKPIYAQVVGGAFSAGYYAIVHATAIYAHRMDEVGSIGTILGTYDFSEYCKQLGVEPVLLATGDHKGAGFFGSVITQEQRDEWMRGVKNFFADFKKQISVGREMSSKAVDDVADGRFWTAGEALKLGLIDKVQGTSATVAQAMAKAAAKNRTAAARAKLDTVLGPRPTPRG